MAEPAVHRYRVHSSWAGSTGAGYDAYDRAHDAVTDPPTIALPVSADPGFRGDADRLNPEQLLVLAASSCQLLSLLSVASRARIDIVGYEDDAEGELPVTLGQIRVTRITLRPRITVRGTVDDDRIRHLVDIAHQECFIANSLNTEIVVEPTILHADAGQ